MNIDEHFTRIGEALADGDPIEATTELRRMAVHHPYEAAQALLVMRTAVKLHREFDLSMDRIMEVFES